MKYVPQQNIYAGQPIGDKENLKLSKTAAKDATVIMEANGIKNRTGFLRGLVEEGLTRIMEQKS